MSSIPRGIAMIPLYANGKIENSPSILFYQPGVYKTTLNNTKKTMVEFSVATRFPEDGNVTITVNPATTSKYKLNLRVPYWATNFTVLVNNKKQNIKSTELASIERVWRKGDKVEIRFEMPVKILEGGESYPGFVAIQRGPQVLVFDQSLNTIDAGKLTINPENLQLKLLKGVLPQGWVGSQVYQLDAFNDGVPVKVILVPFSDASQSDGYITTWFKQQK